MSEVRIIEVGPRDGLQNEAISIPTDEKTRFIYRLRDAGLREIEAGSFVSPKWVPQLGDAETLWPQLGSGPRYSALVPNQRGLDRALAVGVDHIALFTAASEAFTMKNINMTVNESLVEFGLIARRFREERPRGWIRGYISTAFQCPYSGKVTHSSVLQVAESLLMIGVDEISIGDTIGVAVPNEVKPLAKALLQSVPISKLAFHFHDTHGTAIANVSACLDFGLRAFDSSAGGLGGCPYAPGAAGNLATEDLVYFLERSGISTEIDQDLLANATLPILAHLTRPPAAKSQLARLSASASSPK